MSSAALATAISEQGPTIPMFKGFWRAIQNKTTNYYVIEIAI
jgi:hypothetical protein